MGSDIFHMHVLIFWSQLFPLDIFETEVKIYYGDHLCFFVCLSVCLPCVFSPTKLSCDSRHIVGAYFKLTQKTE